MQDCADLAHNAPSQPLAELLARLVVQCERAEESRRNEQDAQLRAYYTGHRDAFAFAVREIQWLAKPGG